MGVGWVLSMAIWEIERYFIKESKRKYYFFKPVLALLF